MLNASLIDNLKRLGLNEYEAKTYLTLAIHGPLSASSISEKGRIPQSKVYEILRSLKVKALAQIWPSKPYRYKAVDPSVALKNIVIEKKTNLNKLENNINDLISKIRPKNTEDDNEFWILKGRKAFLESLASSISKCEKLVYLTTEDFPRKEFLDDAFLSIIRKGAKVKLLGTNLTEHSKVRSKWYKNVGADISLLENNKINIGVFDGREGFIKVGDNEFVWVKNNSLVNILKYYFEMMWSSSKNFR